MTLNDKGIPAPLGQAREMSTKMVCYYHQQTLAFPDEWYCTREEAYAKITYFYRHLAHGVYDEERHSY